jgi:hypothetical protein
MRYLFIIIWLLGSAGCGSIPFQKTVYAPLNSIGPEDVRAQFAQSLPAEFQIISSIVFKYGWHTVSAIGYTRVNAEQNRFTVAGLSPVGVKLFELSGTENGVECTFAMKAFTRRGNFAETIARDIRRIYFDRVPGEDAKICKKKYEIVFTQAADGGKMEYRFAGADTALTEKRYYEGNRRIWSVFYYEYQRQNGKLHPAGIILRHYQHGYQLTIRLKEIRA